MNSLHFMLLLCSCGPTLTLSLMNPLTVLPSEPVPRVARDSAVQFPDGSPEAYRFGNLSPTAQVSERQRLEADMRQFTRSVDILSQEAATLTGEFKALQALDAASSSAAEATSQDSSRGAFFGQRIDGSQPDGKVREVAAVPTGRSELPIQAWSMTQAVQPLEVSFSTSDMLAAPGFDVSQDARAERAESSLLSQGRPLRPRAALYQQTAATAQVGPQPEPTSEASLNATAPAPVAEATAKPKCGGSEEPVCSSINKLITFDYSLSLLAGQCIWGGAIATLVVVSCGIWVHSLTPCQKFLLGSGVLIFSVAALYLLLLLG